MANNLAARLKKQQEIPFLEIRGFTGLSLKLTPPNRPKTSFQVLDNFDLYLPGSIRKILPAVEYGGPYGANLLNCSEYLAQPNNPVGGIRRLLGVGADGNIYDLASATPATPYAVTNYLIGAPSTIPTILQFPGFYIPFNMRSWVASAAYAQYDAVLEYGPDGNVYVFAVLTAAAAGTSGANQPTWPVSGTVTDGTITPPSFSNTTGVTTTDNTVTWTCRGQAAWQANHVYSVGQLIIDSNGNIQEVLAVSGTATSGAHAPIWANIQYQAIPLQGVTIDNGDIEWACLLQPQWQPNFIYFTGLFHSVILDAGGFIQQVTTSGTSGTGSFTGVVWTNVGIPNSNRFFAYFLSIVSPGTQPIRLVEWQYDPTNALETPKVTVGQMGCSPALVPMQLSGQIITPNLNGYAPSSGRAYQWTYYNPQTLNESSPSPFTGKVTIIETDNSNLSVSINGSLLEPLPPSTVSTKYSSYQSYYVAVPVSALVPPIGQGYTSIRVYATDDGGDVFFLVITLYDEDGNQITNSDGSIPIAALKALSVANSWTDYFPLPVPQAKVPSVRMYEGSGPINFVPDPINLGTAAWQAGSGTGIYVASGTAPDGANAFQIDGPNAGLNTFNSVFFAVTNQTYYFQAFMDKTNGTGGTMAIRIYIPGGTVLQTFTQADGTAGIVSGTFNPNPHKNIAIQIYVTGVTITSGDSLQWADLVLQAGSSLNPAPTNYPTPDANLTIPAPLPFSNNPPPIARSAELFLDALMLVDHVNPTKLWYSQQSGYEKFPTTNYVQSSTDKAPTIMQIVRVLDRLLLLKERSIEQVSTYPPSSPSAVDPQHGALAYRAGVPFGVALFALLTNGLGRLSLAQAISESQSIDAVYETVLVGDDIKPIIDTFSPGELHAQNLTTALPSPTILNDLDLFLIAYTDINPISTNFNRYILARYMGRSAGFSRFIPFAPGTPALDMITLREVQPPAGGTGGFAGAGSGDAYVIALRADATSQILFAGTQDGTLTATAVTQPLPTLEDIPPELWDTQKTFRTMWVEGSDINNFQVSFSTDGGLTFPYGPYPLTQRYKMGIPGQQLTIKFTHSVATSVTPTLTYIRLDYDIDAGQIQGNQ